jgi:hypothetical protein
MKSLHGSKANANNSCIVKRLSDGKDSKEKTFYLTLRDVKASDKVRQYLHLLTFVSHVALLILAFEFVFTLQHHSLLRQERAGSFEQDDRNKL